MTLSGTKSWSSKGTPVDRIVWIDAAKGLGILLIVLGHVWSLDDPSFFYEWMYAFHVPLFFFVSGLTLKPGTRSMLDVTRAKAVRLMVPYFVYAFLGYLMFLVGFIVVQWTGANIEQFSHGLLPPLLAIFHGTLGDGLLTNSPLWFLPALFVTYVLGYAINTYLSWHGPRLIMIAALSALGIWVGDSLRLPFSVIPALISLVFFQAGYYMRYLGLAERSASPYLWLVFVLSLTLSLLAPLNGFIGVGKGIVQNPVIFLVFAFVGIASASLFAKMVTRLDGGMLAFIGRHSLSILVVHMLVIKVVKVLIIVAFGVGQDAIETSFLMGLAVLLISGWIMVPTIWVMERWLPLTLGRWQEQQRSHAENLSRR
jgi:fucose 4-O-acetylase-like acetyltransferase